MITNSNFLFEEAEFEDYYEYDFSASEYFTYVDNGSIFLIDDSNSTRARQIYWACDDEDETSFCFFFRDLQATMPLPILDSAGEMLGMEDPDWLEDTDWIPFEPDEDLLEFLYAILELIEDS